MIFIENISFLYVLVFIIIYNSFSVLFKNKSVSNILLLMGSVTVLATVLNPVSIGIILLISSLVFFAGRFLKKGHKNNRIYLSIFICVLISLFIIKNYKLVDLDLLQRLGLSYVLFRLIHFLIESSKKKINEYSVLSFINYIIFFPNFIAGPIDEYNNFTYWVKQNRNSYRLILFKVGVFKLLLGVVKKFFLVPIIINHALDFSFFEGSLGWQGDLFTSLLLYSLYILFDFSGYSDIAIGTAYLIGIKTPENFDNPYFSSSLSVFWKKWHMTFSNFLFKYLFKPIVTNLSLHLKRTPRLLISSIGYLLTFIACGVWHGNTLSFIYWGLWHGVGLIFFKLWDVYIYQKYISEYRNFIFRKIYNILAICFTFLFVTCGWFFFNYKTNEIAMILNNITVKDSKEMKVSTVTLHTFPIFKIEYTNNDISQYIDIKYKSFENDNYIEYFNVPVNDNNTYYLRPKKNDKRLSNVKIRSSFKKEKDEWYSTLLYSNGVSYKQSWLEETFFGKNTIPIQLKEAPEGLLEGLLEDPYDLPPEYLNQEIETKTYFIDNYGWAIELNYKEYPEAKITVDYKFNDGEWIRYTQDRDGKYNYVHVHGKEVFNGTSRNLPPGTYKVRIRYEDYLKKSKWFDDAITIPDYVNN